MDICINTHISRKFLFAFFLSILYLLIRNVMSILSRVISPDCYTRPELNRALNISQLYIELIKGAFIHGALMAVTVSTVLLSEILSSERNSRFNRKIGSTSGISRIPPASTDKCPACVRSVRFHSPLTVIK